MEFMVRKPHHPPRRPGAPHGPAADEGAIGSVAAYLRSALPPAWQAEDVIDPAGERSLVVLAANDDPEIPTFLLHHRDLVPHVATILADEWRTDQRFALWPDAAQAILAMVLATQVGSGAAVNAAVSAAA